MKTTNNNSKNLSLTFEEKTGKLSNKDLKNIAGGINIRNSNKGLTVAALTGSMLLGSSLVSGNVSYADAAEPVTSSVNALQNDVAAETQSADLWDVDGGIMAKTIWEGNTTKLSEIINAGVSQNTLNIALHSILKKQYCSDDDKKNIDMVKFIIENGADVNALLYQFANEGNINAILLLIENGANVAIKNDEGKVPMIYGIELKNFLKKDFDFNIKDGNGLTILDRVIADFNGEVANYLFEKGADITENTAHNSEALWSICTSGNIMLLKRAVSLGADVNAELPYGLSMLYLACVSKNNELFDFLIAQGANVNKPNAYGVTLLYDACSMNAKDMVEYLLQKGVDPNIKINHSEIANYCYDGTDPFDGKDFTILDVIKHNNINSDFKISQVIVDLLKTYGVKKA
ncbi:hypothetical protein FACS189465_2960 [Clostridia bacterium]|nr:hypothetical protein FACS189465_2960 [Clostridia bacterium]